MAQFVCPFMGVSSKNLSQSPMGAHHLRHVTLSSFMSLLEQWTGEVLLFILTHDLSSRTRQESNKCITDTGKKLIMYLQELVAGREHVLSPKDNTRVGAA